MNQLEKLLQDQFKLTKFRDGQEKVINSLLKNESALALFPTGGGKSLCFQLPAVMFDCLTLVISPLIALMKDQVESLRALGVSARRLDSTLSYNEVLKVYDEIREKKLKLLYISPERLSNESFLTRINKIKISLLVVDEAHCISGWGHNFRPEYLKIAKIAKKYSMHPILALTATSTPEVSKDILNAFTINETNFIKRSFLRNNLSLFVTPTTEDGKLNLLCNKLSKSHYFPCIIYVTLQRTAEDVSNYLVSKGFRASYYHAGLKDDVRSKIQDQFMHDQLDIIVATIAFGMGIDKSNIRSVFHFNLPKSLENYQQEVGRAGRDGQPSHCELLGTPSDIVVLQNFIYADTPEPNSIKFLVDFIFKHENFLDVSFYELSRLYDLKTVVLETLFTYLELEDVIEPVSTYYFEYDILLTKPVNEIISKHTPERQKFLHSLFNFGKQGTKWLKLNIEQCSSKTNEPQDKIVKALQWLEGQKEIQLKPSGLKNRFRIFPKIHSINKNQLIKKLQKLFYDREKMELSRINNVVNFINHSHCLTQYLLQYFGESQSQRCGHCSSCHSESKTNILKDTHFHHSQNSTIVNFNQQIMDLIKALKLQNLSSIQIARFLCGQSSPSLIKLKLTKHRHFGTLQSYSFNDILALIEN